MGKITKRKNKNIVDYAIDEAKKLSLVITIGFEENKPVKRKIKTVNPRRKKRQ